MAGPQTVWGIDVGKCALKAIKLRVGSDKSVEVVADTSAPPLASVGALSAPLLSPAAHPDARVSHPVAAMRENVGRMMPALVDRILENAPRATAEGVPRGWSACWRRSYP